MKSSQLKRKSAMKRSQPRRDWTAAREKVSEENECRVCGRSAVGIEAAHIIGRECDLDSRNGFVWGHDANAYFVRPDRVIPLCRKHHRQYDPPTRGTQEPLDILHVLTLEEQVQAVRDAGGIENARKRLAPSCYRPSRGERDDEQRS